MSETPTDPWLIACRRFEVAGKAIASTVFRFAGALAMVGVARAIWAMVDAGLERR